ncbi:MAG: sigma-70 family RNA polymerase sigma factor [Actinomycetota bacterium]
MKPEPAAPNLPEGVDEDEYKKIRRLMRSSVLSAWGKYTNDLVAGMDAWDVVDDSWASMAEKGFRCKGPFRQHACVAARNKAIDRIRRTKPDRVGPSLDALGVSDSGAGWNEVPGEAIVPSAEETYEEALRLAVIEAAIQAALDEREQEIFHMVQIDKKSRAAVGRELDPPMTGQRVGQVLAEAVLKIRAHLQASRDLFAGQLPGPADEEPS